MTVASVENHSPLSNVSVYVRAGSRFEKYNQLGATHLLRESAYLVSVSIVNVFVCIRLSLC